MHDAAKCECSSQAQGWLLRGGKHGFSSEIGLPERQCMAGLRFYQWMIEMENSARRVNQQCLRELALMQGKDVRLFCSRDAQALRALQNR
ncbi:hypothetical protein [Kosakonia quasisacchari]|uniref:hypothetical protein n=1 Tax=Kosakonia quasisacchari TaxID=2529380 RepID=UPI0039E03CFE